MLEWLEWLLEIQTRESEELGVLEIGLDFVDLALCPHTHTMWQGCSNLHILPKQLLLKYGFATPKRGFLANLCEPCFPLQALDDLPENRKRIDNFVACLMQKVLVIIWLTM